jgi:hypothetical protein
MKNRLLGFLILFFLVGALLSLQSCATKTGCKVNENVHANTRKDGSYSTKPGRSSLFPKNFSKKKKKN